MDDANLHDENRRGADEAVDVGAMHAPFSRESDEPEDGHEPIPLVWLLTIMALMMGGGWYLGKFSENFSAQQYDGSAPETTVAAAQAPKVEDPRVTGRRVYLNCMACHQQDGRGIAGQFPPLASSEWVSGQPETLIQILLHGLQNEVVVANAKYNGVMPAWGRLSDEQLASVLTYVRGSWGNNNTAVTPQQVAEQRQKTHERQNAWSAQELEENGYRP